MATIIQTQKITPCLWFDNQAEEAVKFYTSLFKKSKILHTSHYGKSGAEGSGMPEGTVMTVSFQLAGQNFMALNGGPVFKFNEAISLMVDCKDQKEVDYFWEKLTENGGQENVCGWLKDKYGLSWQIVPSVLGKYMQDKDPKKVERVMQAMLNMKKMDVQGLKEAAESE